MTLNEAVEQYLQKRKKVYEADRKELRRNAKSAQREASDHVGRWFYELFQNSDDAKATKVLVRVTSHAIYIADNGEGLRPSAVDAISSTDASDKESGIGRKGIGFKAVYSITNNPQVFTLNMEGIEFSEGRAREWLAVNNLLDTHVPFQWLPFFVSRSEAEAGDPLLSKLHDYATVVKLPLGAQDNTSFLDPLHWNPYSLLPFNNVRTLMIEDETNKDQTKPMLVIDKEKVGWYSQTECVPAKDIPAGALDALTSDERGDICARPLKFLVAAPQAKGIAVPTDVNLPVHVFYPADHDLAPVRLLLHAEFLTKSDRTALVPISGNPFNEWVADRLASLICRYVQGQYSQESPAAYLRLLHPMPGRETHITAPYIWGKIREQANQHLKLPGADGAPTLPLSQGRLLAVHAESAKARIILAGTPMGENLLYSPLDDEKEAHAVLTELGVRKVTDEDVLESAATQKANDHDRVWASWEWLAAWYIGAPSYDERKQRLEKITLLPIVPVGGLLKSSVDLHGQILTWRAESLNSVHEWLPLVLVDDWFRDRARECGEFKDKVQPPVCTLIAELGIAAPDKDTLRSATQRAIDDYWKHPLGAPDRFLRFIMDQRWHEGQQTPSEKFAGCPVLATIQGKPEPQWVRAEEAYLGRDWGNSILEELYQDTPGIAWASPMVPLNDMDYQATVLQWLGALRYPRIVPLPRSDADNVRAKHSDYYRRQLKELTKFHLKQKKLGVETVRSNRVELFRPREGSFYGALDRLDPGTLTPLKAAKLIEILAVNWHGYYGGQARMDVWYEPSGCGGRAGDVWDLWFDGVLNGVVPPLSESYSEPAPLSRCWMPDKSTRPVKAFLPIIDSEAFGTHRAEIEQWLRWEVRVRSAVAEITIEEWKQILHNAARVFPAERVSEVLLRNRIGKLYVACLRALSNMVPGQPAECLCDVPLLCRRGEEWRYIGHKEERWLAEDPSIENAFADHMWLCLVPKSRKEAAKFFGLRRLVPEVRLEMAPEAEAETATVAGLLAQALPYIYAWFARNADGQENEIRCALKTVQVSVRSAITGQLIMEVDGQTRTSSASWRWGYDLSSAQVHLYLLCDATSDPAYELAAALSSAMGKPKQAADIEILLRCKGRPELRKRLQRDMGKEALDAALGEWGEAESDEPLSPTLEGGIAKPAPESREPQAEEGSAARPADKKAAVPLHPAPPSAPAQELHSPLRLKDPAIADIAFGEAPPSSGGRDGSGGESGGRSIEQQEELSSEDKWEVERAGRECVKRVLEKEGFVVELMPRKNPGYDIRATREGRTLRVEVKAHKGISRIVELTSREYVEYGKGQWELWNVENLSADVMGSVRITRYDSLPDEAMDTRVFRVDLAHCHSIEWGD